MGLSLYAGDDLASSEVETVAQRQFTLQEVDLLARATGFEVSPAVIGPAWHIFETVWCAGIERAAQLPLPCTCCRPPLCACEVSCFPLPSLTGGGGAR